MLPSLVCLFSVALSFLKPNNEIFLRQESFQVASFGIFDLIHFLGIDIWLCVDLVFIHFKHSFSFRYDIALGLLAHDCYAQHSETWFLCLANDTQAHNGYADKILSGI